MPWLMIIATPIFLIPALKHLWRWYELERDYDNSPLLNQEEADALYDVTQRWLDAHKASLTVYDITVREL